MKRIFYLCCMMLTCLDMMAQFNSNNGWKCRINEDFSGTGRGWDACYEETRPTSIPADSAWKRQWCAKGVELYDGVTKAGGYQAFQRSNALFNNATFNDNKMRLVSEYISYYPLLCDVPRPKGYELPKFHYCNANPNDVFYYSGNIQSRRQDMHYGYYEAECALPVHEGAHASFWLYGCHTTSTDSIYEEIDIVEYSVIDRDYDTCRGYSSGIWYNGQTVNYTLEDHYGYVNNHIPQTSPDIRYMHTYGCEWMPDHVVFYRDGKVTSEFRDGSHIPKHVKFLKLGYSIDGFAVDKTTTPPTPVWQGSDTLTINRISVYELETDCHTDTNIQNALQFNQVDKMKQSITIGNANGITLSSSTNKTLRASDYILINGPFEIPSGAQLTLMVHECPESSE